MFLSSMVSVLEIREKLSRMWPHLNERGRRMVAASEAAHIGYGGVTLISQACGLSRVTITKGIRELEESPLPAHRTRGPGGGGWRPMILGWWSYWSRWWNR